MPGGGRGTIQSWYTPQAENDLVYGRRGAICIILFNHRVRVHFQAQCKGRILGQDQSNTMGDISSNSVPQPAPLCHIPRTTHKININLQFRSKRRELSLEMDKKWAKKNSVYQILNAESRDYRWNVMPVHPPPTQHCSTWVQLNTVVHGCSSKL